MRKINIISYNVLSPELIDAHLTNRESFCLDPEYRLNLIKGELSKFIETNHPIIVLQELSQEWADKLLIFFEVLGYRLYWSRGASSFTGYMGVAIAWPVRFYKLTRMKTAVPSDMIPRYPYLKKRPWYTEWKPFSWFFTLPNNEWQYAKNKKNSALIATFQTLDNTSFVVSTYHMPCAFKQPLTMLLHVVAIIRTTSREAGDLPTILAGDFNIQPDSPIYRYLIGPSELIFDEMAIPDELYDFLRINSLGFKSCYSPQPKFTNRALFQINSRRPVSFEGTIDYIFINDKFKVEHTLPLLSFDELPEPKYLPTCGIPSDHLPLGATLILATAE